LSYTLAPQANGPATVTVKLHDGGGTEHSGVDTSAQQTFSITVTAVNDAPSFIAGPNQLVDAGVGPQTVLGWAQGISPGPSNEALQRLLFAVTGNTNPGLFGADPADAPAVDASTGELRYRPAAGTSGSAQITLVLIDNGSRDNGGADTSPPQTFTIRVAQPLGTIALTELPGQNPSSHPLLYAVDTVRAGYLTAEALDSTATLTVYSQDFQQQWHSSVNGAARVDVLAGQAGERYYVELAGAGTAITLRLANLVTPSGSTLDVAATGQDDQFRFNAAARQLVIDNVAYPVDPATFTQIAFHGSGSGDSAVLTGNGGNDSVELWPGAATFTAGGVTTTLSGTSTITVDGAGGANSAVLHDSAGIDQLVMRQTDVVQSDQNHTLYSHTLYGFKTVLAKSTQGGPDVATLYDSAGSDTFTARPNWANMAAAGVYSFTAEGYVVVFGRATAGGYDLAFLTDSAGNDVYEGRPTSARMFGAGYDNQAVSFEASFATASRGYDVASLYDSAGNDLFVAGPTESRLSGAGFYHLARAFDVVHAYGGQGNDVALMYDSSGNDRFTAKPTESVMSGTGYFNRAKGFKMVQAFGSGGYDEAYLYDTALVDVLEADYDWARLSGASPQYSNYVKGFDKVYATSIDDQLRNEKRIGANLNPNFLFFNGLW